MSYPSETNCSSRNIPPWRDSLCVPFVTWRVISRPSTLMLFLYVSQRPCGRTFTLQFTSSPLTSQRLFEKLWIFDVITRLSFALAGVFSVFWFVTTSWRSILRTKTRTMLPLRRRSRVQDRNVVADAALLNGYSVQQLRNLCRQKKIASTGNKATLLNRLRGPGPQVTASNVNVGVNLRAPNLPAYEGADPQDHVVNASANDITFSEGQLNTIRQLFQESVAAASREIANEAALAAVQVLQPSSSQTASNSNRVTPAIEPVAPQQTASPSDVRQHAAPFQDIPAQYVKDIQSGEFFELSKLLPKNLSELNEDDNLVLTLDNSVVRVSKKAKTSTSITEIEQWTTAFTTYMIVFTQKFPQRSQEFLQYLSLIILVYFRLIFRSLFYSYCSSMGNTRCVFWGMKCSIQVAPLPHRLTWSVFVAEWAPQIALLSW